jgi:Zn-dependent peptidase ImmA (M78 family)
VSKPVLSWILDVGTREGIDNDTYSALMKWHSGEITPTFAKIEDVSSKTHIPLGYFFLNEPPKEDLPILEYRTMDSISVQNPSRELTDTVYYMENIQNWMHDYRVDTIGEPLQFVGSLKNEKNINFFANKIRNDIRLGTQWYKSVSNKEVFTYLRTLFENAGVIITMNGVVGQNNHRVLNTDEFRAFTLIDDYAPLIFINANDSDGARLFSLLHEAAHVWAGVSSFYNDRLGNHKSTHQSEALCNAVAAEILVPNDFFIEQWQEYSQNDWPFETIISNLAKGFKCGETVIARRALDNHYIDNSQYESIAKLAIKYYRKLKAKNRETGSGGNYYGTEISRYGKPLLLALNESVKENKTLYMDAYRLIDTYGSTFEKLMEHVKGTAE